LFLENQKRILQITQKGSGAIYRTVIRRGINCATWIVSLALVAICEQINFWAILTANATATNYFALYSITNFTYYSFFTNSTFLCYHKKEAEERYFWGFYQSDAVFRF